MQGKEDTQAEKEETKEELKDDEGEEPIYYEKEGKQYVRPYMNEFKTFVKKRWLGVSIIEIFTK